MNSKFKVKSSYNFEDLVALMEVLRGENGCPWDREQDHKSIRNNFIEEVYEAVEAIDTENPELLQEELGDVLLQVVFHARMEEETGGFDINAVCDGICKKLVHRHPHIFLDVSVSGTDDVLSNWNEIKRAEKKQTTVKKEMSDVARSLPALMRTQKVIKRGANSGVISLEPGKVLSDLKSLVSSLDENVSKEQLGEILFDVCRLCQARSVEGEEVLYESCDRFIDECGNLS